MGGPSAYHEQQVWPAVWPALGYEGPSHGAAGKMPISVVDSAAQKHAFVLSQPEKMRLRHGFAVQGKVVKQKSRFATEAGAAEDAPDDSPTGQALVTRHTQASGLSRLCCSVSHPLDLE